MRRLTVLLMLFCATVALPACGGDKEADRPAVDKEREAKPKERSQTLTECLKGSGLEIERRDGNVIRARDPEKGAKATITTFRSGAKASEFAGGLKGSATQAGKAVAAYSSESNPTKTAVDTCLSKVG